MSWELGRSYPAPHDGWMGPCRGVDSNGNQKMGGERLCKRCDEQRGMRRVIGGKRRGSGFYSAAYSSGEST